MKTKNKIFMRNFNTWIFSIGSIEATKNITVMDKIIDLSDNFLRLFGIILQLAITGFTVYKMYKELKAKKQTPCEEININNSNTINNE